MKICCISDLHGFLPMDIKTCDILLVAGDVSVMSSLHDVDYETKWYNENYRTWVAMQPAKLVVTIPGNHDFMLEKFWKENKVNVKWYNLREVLLVDGTINYQGLKIHGTPWVPNLKNWAFYANDEQLKVVAGRIPDDVDIVMSHGPAKHIFDRVPSKFNSLDDTKWPDSESVGSESLLARLMDLKQLKLHLCGHIHEGYGYRKIGDVHFVNASIMDVNYNPVNKPIYLEI